MRKKTSGEQVPPSYATDLRVPPHPKGPINRTPREMFDKLTNFAADLREEIRATSVLRERCRDSHRRRDYTAHQIRLEDQIHIVEHFIHWLQGVD